jgi:RND family efflux transporter MFP subunit
MMYSFPLKGYTCLSLLVAGAFCLMTGAQAQQATPAGNELDCVIEPHRVIKLGSPDAGLLAEVPVDRGDYVKRRQIVAKLASGIEAATVELARVRANSDVDLRSARARLAFQEQEFERIKMLHRKKVVADKLMQENRRELSLINLQVQEAQLASRVAKLELKRALEILQQRTLLSPINGVVVERSLSPGEYIFEQTHVMTLAQIDPLNVEVFVPTSQFEKIAVGQRARVRPLLPNGKDYFASVKVVDQVFDAASGTFGVRLELPNPQRKLPSGLKCKVQFLK